MPKKKLNYYRLCTFIVLLIVIVFLIVKAISNYNYKKTDEYKLFEHGFSESEVNTLLGSLDKNKINDLLKMKYDKNIVVFLGERYFLYKNFNKYLDYRKENEKLSSSEIVTIVNTETNVEWIDNMKDTDTSKGELILVNRIYGLKEDYVIEDITDIPVRYAYSGKKIKSSILDKIVDLIEAGREQNYTFVVSEGYRSNKDQAKLYNNYKNNYGISEADKIVARPGHSEYQTGLTFDLVPYNKVMDKPKESEEYIWLSQNAYKYGFIFRFPEEKTDITQYNASTWKLRYVGENAALKIYNESLSFEEYYAYYVVGESNE